MILLAPMAIASLATQALSSGFSFAQGIREKKLMKEAQREADIALREAEGFLEKNQYEKLSVPKQDIALARANVDARNQATLQAAQEGSQRGVAAVGGQIAQSQADMEQKLLAQAEQREAAKAQLVAQEDAQTDEQLASLRINTAEGAQQAAADAYAMGNAYMGDAATSALGVLESGLAIPDLYKGDKKDIDTTDMTQKYKEKATPIDKNGDGIPDAMQMFNNKASVTTPTNKTTTNNPTTPTKTYGYGGEFDAIVGTSYDDIKKYQDFVLSKGGDLGTSKTGVPFGADGKIGTKSRRDKKSPTIATFAEFKDDYIEYLKNNP
jgi:hypothetical protein